MCANITLGTVKFGVPNYGFCSEGKSNSPEELLSYAYSLGVKGLDTSPRYGESESIIGRFLKKHPGTSFAISSKVDCLQPNDKQSLKKIYDSALLSLKKLNVGQLETLYLHQNELALISDPYIQEGLRVLKDKGLVRKVGCSLYSTKECEYAVKSGFFDVIQLPVNICDSGFYAKFIENKQEIGQSFVARSIFLQGIIFKDKIDASRNRHAQFLNIYLKELQSISRESGCSISELALGFLGSLKNLDSIIIGTLNIRNLEENIQNYTRKMSIYLLDDLRKIALSSKEWSNPRNW